AFGEWLFVADGKLIRRVDRKGNVEVYVPADAFPAEPKSLEAIDADEQGRLYVADGKGGVIYSVRPKAKKAERVVDTESTAALRQPYGLAMDGLSFLILSDAATGKLYELKLADKSLRPRADGAGGPVAWDKFGRLFFSDAKGGRL